MVVWTGVVVRLGVVVAVEVAAVVVVPLTVAVVVRVTEVLPLPETTVVTTVVMYVLATYSTGALLMAMLLPSPQRFTI